MESSPGGITINGYRGSSLQFDDQGITVRNPSSRRIGWAEVYRLGDGSIGGDYGPGYSAGSWVLAVILHNGRTVVAEATRGLIPSNPSDRARSKAVLSAIVQAAVRYDIPADLSGTIERGSFPATLLGESGTITVTIIDGHLDETDSKATLGVIQRTEPVQPGDILALAYDGAEVEVLAVRQVVADRRWEQIAYAYLLLPDQPGARTARGGYGARLLAGRWLHYLRRGAVHQAGPDNDGV